jgi:hypothetical protein
MSQKVVLITVTASIPPADKHAGHKGVVMSEDAVEAVKKALESAGLTVVDATREIVTRTGPRAAPVTLTPVPPPE